MKLANYTWRGTKCDLMSISAICLFLFAVYELGSRFYESHEKGVVVFRYHSNLFYGNEAVIMYITFLVLIIVLSISVLLGIRKCYKNIENNGSKTKI